MAEPYDLAAEVVALHYDPKTSGAPQLVAKGSGHIGNRIIELAQQHQIPLYHNWNSGMKFRKPSTKPSPRSFCLPGSLAPKWIWTTISRRE